MPHGGLAFLHETAKRQRVARPKCPQAIAFGTDVDIIMLDKEAWFPEIIVIKHSEKVEATPAQRIR